MKNHRLLLLLTRVKYSALNFGDEKTIHRPLEALDI